MQQSLKTFDQIGLVRRTEIGMRRKFLHTVFLRQTFDSVRLKKYEIVSARYSFHSRPCSKGNRLKSIIVILFDASPIH